MNPFTLARRPIALVCLAVAALALTGCGTAPVHPTLQAAQASGQLPPLVPMRRFVANVDAHGGFTLSPDGQQLLWSRVVGTEAGLAARGVDEPEATARPIATGHLARRDIGGGTYAGCPTAATPTTYATRAVTRPRRSMSSTPARGAPSPGWPRPGPARAPPWWRVASRAARAFSSPATAATRPRSTCTRPTPPPAACARWRAARAT